MPIDLDDIHSFIVFEAELEDLMFIQGSLDFRLKKIAPVTKTSAKNKKGSNRAYSSINAVFVGDRVRFKQAISWRYPVPNYLAGVEGTIHQIFRTRVEVLIDKDPKAGWRSGEMITVSYKNLSKITTLIPVFP